MLESVLSGGAASVTLPEFLLLTGCSLAFGMAVALLYMYRHPYSHGFVLTLAVLPAIVQLVILMVNGNLGTGVAVMGAFSLIRFRSVPGSARDIGAIFLAMALGLATGTGYLLAACLFLVIVGAFQLALTSTRFGVRPPRERELKITIPETMAYGGLFDDLFSAYTQSAELVRVRTTNMGSLYELLYRVTLRAQCDEKAFIDQLRCRNGNLNIVLGHIPSHENEL